MAIYQFILTPLDKFYFGKERHPLRKSYFMESNPFPQQTGILGLVRHYLLISQDILGKKEEWDVIIGKKGFDGSPKQDFGKIKKIYPVFIYDMIQKEILPIKKLYNLNYIKKNGVKVSYNNIDTKELHTVSDNNESYKLTNQLDLKCHLFDDSFIFNDSSLPLQMYGKLEDFKYGDQVEKHNQIKGVFIKHSQPGILKSYKADVKKDDSYFKIEYLKLNKGYHFSFFAEIDLILDKTQPVFMTFGGESSPFRVSVKPIESITPFVENKSMDNIFHFLSDTIIKRSAFDYVIQFIGETQYFRFMKTDAKINLSGLYNIIRTPAHLKNQFGDSKLIIKKGSIAFVKKEMINDFIEAINNNDIAGYKKIGFNYFRQLNKL